MLPRLFWLDQVLKDMDCSHTAAPRPSYGDASARGDAAGASDGED